MRRRTFFGLIGVGAVGGLLAILFGVPFDPDFCEHRCPICTKARKGQRWAQFLQKVEMFVTCGGCPWGRARQKKYGVPPNESVPLTARRGPTLPTIDRHVAGN
jgi:hypothetical protein